MKQDSGTAKRRVSFLMPYIDFCFMLIIIFVGMISIAYFEPLGATNFQTKKDKTLEHTEGRFEIMPRGIEARNAGAGMDASAGVVRPLKAPESGLPRMLTPRGMPAPRPGPRAAAQGKGKYDKQLKGNGNIPKEEMDKLKKELEEQKKKIEELEKMKKGQGNHLYIDLRKQE